LLAVRLYWGWQFMQTGWGKLNDSQKVIGFFTHLGIPAPALNAYFISGLEFAGGFFLILGLGSRMIALPLAIDMMVAYIAADREALFSIFSDPDKFTGAAPYTFLVASLIVLIFGPGKASVDAFLTARLSPRRRAESDRPWIASRPAELSGPMWQHGLNVVRQEGAQTL
jgi:putative oxidoreductase